MHRLIKLSLSLGKVPLVVVEVQSGSYLGEDDVVRFEAPSSVASARVHAATGPEVRSVATAAPAFSQLLKAAMLGSACTLFALRLLMGRRR